MIATCRSCKARIVWAITARGKRMPFDMAPTRDGNMVLERSGLAESLLRARPVELMDLGVERYMPHHATCPDADRWRRG